MVMFNQAEFLSPSAITAIIITISTIGCTAVCDVGSAEFFPDTIEPP
jgi:hypothetical protein